LYAYSTNQRAINRSSVALNTGTIQTPQLTTLVCSEILRYLIHTKFGCSSTVTSSYYNKQNIKYGMKKINNKQQPKSWDKNYAEYTAGTQTIGHFRIARAVSQGSKVHSWH